MATLPYLSTPPTGADFNELLTELDRRVGLVLAGCSPLVPCVRGAGLDGNAVLNPLWADMANRTHDLLGYRFSFTAGAVTPYHDLADLQLGTWPDYDHAALTAIANAATVLIQDDDFAFVVVPSNTDTQKLEGSLECHTREITSGDYAGEFYPLAVSARPQRRHEHAVAELVVEGRTTFTVPRTWHRFGCFRIHNLSREPLAVTVEKLDPGEASDTFTVKGYGVQAFRRADDGYYDRSLTYWWKWRNTRERPVFLEAAGLTTAGQFIPEQSCRANPITRLMGLLDWLLYFGAELDPRELPDLSAQFPMFASPATAAVFGDLIHFRGDVWAIGYPTDSALPPEIRKGTFGGYGSLVADWAELGVTVTESGGVHTLSRAAEDAPGDAAHGLDVFTPGSNLLHGPDFHVFRTLPYALEHWVPLFWPVTPFTAELSSTPWVVKTLTNTVTGDYAETYTEDSVDVDRLVATRLIWRVTYFDRVSGVATVTLAENHTLTVGQWVRVELDALPFTGVVQVTAVPTGNTFRFASPGGANVSLASTGRVTGAPSRQLLADAPTLPTVAGVEWAGTWRLTPCGWRASWTYEVALEAPGLLVGLSQEGYLTGLYDDLDAEGFATHRGTVTVLGQGWPLDDSATPAVAGTGTRHALTPDYPRRYRHQVYDAELGYHDPGFTGYLGRVGGGDLAPVTRTATTYGTLRTLRPVGTFRRNPATNAATHKLAAIEDSAHVPLVQETVACADPASIFGQRAALRTETGNAPGVGEGAGGTSWHYLPVAPWRYNLLAWHVNAWTRSAPACTVLDVIAGDYLVGETVCWFTLGSLGANYDRGVVGYPFPGVGRVPRGFVGEVEAAYLPALADIGLPVQTEAAFAAQVAAIDAALAAPVKSLHWKQTTTELDAEFVFIPPIPEPDPGISALLTYRYQLRRTLRSTLSTESPPGSFSTTPLADEAGHAEAIKAELEGFTHWLRASDLKDLAEEWELPFVFEQAGHPVKLFTAASETPAILRADSTWAVAERTEAWAVNSLEAVYDLYFPAPHYDNFHPDTYLPIPTPPLPDGSLPAAGTVSVSGYFNIYGPFGVVTGQNPATMAVPYTWSGDPTNIDTGTHVGATQTTNVAGALVRWQPVETAGACEFLGEASGAFSAAQLIDELYAPFDWDNQRGGPWQTPRVGDPVWLLRRGDNPTGGFSPSSLLGPPFPTPVRTFSPAAQAISDGRPASIRAIDRELNRAHAIETATHDPGGKLVRATRLLAWKAYDLSFNAAWLTASAANLALGPHAIPRTLTAASGLVTAEVVADGLTVLAPPEGETGVWEVGVRHAIYLDLA
jgi:hypothetical protein